MKQHWAGVVLVALLGLLVLGAVTQEDYTAVRIDSFNGITNGYASPDFSHPTDMMNFDLVNNGGRMMLRQRRGYENYIGAQFKGQIKFARTIWASDGTTNQHMLFLVTTMDSAFTTIAAPAGTPTWNAVRDMGSEFDGDYLDCLTFKDTVLVLANSKLTQLGMYANGRLEYVTAFTGWAYASIATFKDRLYAGGTNLSAGNWDNRLKVIYRPEFDIDGDSIDTKYNSGFFYVADKSGGSFIVCIRPLGEYLMIYTTSGVMRMSVNSTDNTPYDVTTVSPHYGTFNNESVVEWGGAHYFVNEFGVFVTDGGSVNKISAGIDDFWRDSTEFKETSYDVYFNGVGYYFSGITALDGKIYVSVPVDTSIVAGHRTFVYDVLTGQWTKYSIAMSRFMLPIPSRVTFLMDNTLQGGDYSASAQPTMMLFTRNKLRDTTIYIYPYSNKDNASYILSKYEVRASDLGDMWHRKQITRASMFIQGSGSVQIGFYADTMLSFEEGEVFTANSTPMVHTERVNPLVEGQVLGFRLQTASAESLQVYGVEFGLRRTGGGQED